MRGLLCVLLVFCCVISVCLASTTKTFTFSKDGLSLFVSDSKVIRKVKEQTLHSGIVGCSNENCQVSEMFISGVDDDIFYLHNNNEIRRLDENGDSSVIVNESDETKIHSFIINEYEEIIYSTQNLIKKRLSNGKTIIISGNRCEKNPDECIQPGHIAEDPMNEVIYFYDYRVNSIRKIEYETISTIEGSFGYSTFDIKHGTIYCSDGHFVKRIQIDSSFDIIAGIKDEGESTDGALAKDSKLEIAFLKVSPVWGEEQVYFISTIGELRKIDKNGKLITIMKDSSEMVIPKKKKTTMKNTRATFDLITTNVTENNSTNSTMNIDYYPDVNVTSLISPDGSGIKFNVIYGRSDIYKHQLFFSGDSAYNMSSCQNNNSGKSIKLTLVEKSDQYLTENYTSNYIPITTLLSSSSVQKESRGNYLQLVINLAAQYVDEVGYFNGGYCRAFTYNVKVVINLLISTPSVTNSLTVDSQNYEYSIYPTSLNIVSSARFSVDFIVESNFLNNEIHFVNTTSPYISDFEVYSTESLGVRNSFNYSKYSLEAVSDSYDLSGSYQFNLLYYTYSGSFQATSFKVNFEFSLSSGIPQNNTCSNHGLALAYSKCLCYDGYTGTNCQTFNCFGIESSNSTVCSGRGTCIGSDICSCYPGFGGNQCQDQNTQSFSIAVTLSSTKVVQGGSQLVTANISTSAYPISNLNFTLICLNCGLGKSFAQTDSFVLDFSSLSIGSYYFTLYATTLDSGAVSKPVDFVIQVTSQTYRSIDSYSQFGIPSYFVRSNSITFEPIFFNITLADSSVVSDFKCLNQACSFKYTYSINLRKSLTKVPIKEVTGLLNGYGSGNTIVFSPMFQLSSVLSLTSDVTKVTVDLTLSSNLQNLIAYIEIPVYDAPKLPTQVSISPSTGVAISTLFNMSSSEWISDNALLPLSYAYGFYHPILKKSIRVTSFSSNRFAQVPLPFVSSSALSIIAFVSDVNGNTAEYTFGSVGVTSYSGSTSALLKTATDALKTAILYDQSASSSSESILEKVNTITVDSSNAQTSLLVLSLLTSDSSKVSSSVASQVNKVVDSFIGNSVDTYIQEYNTYGYVKSKVSVQVLTSTLDVLSNIFSSQSSSSNSTNSIDNSLATFNNLLLRGLVPSVLGSNIATESITSGAISSYVASVVLPSSSSGSSVGTFNSGSGNSISINVLDIAKAYGGESAVIGLSSVIFSKNLNTDSGSSNRTSSSSVLDFKYYQNFKYTKLSNLLNPISLNLGMNKDALSNLNNQTQVVCRYWDEDSLKWSTDGCVLVSFDNNQANCSCNHTTKFSTFIEYKDYPVVNIEQVSKLYYAEIAFGIFFGLLSGTILVLLIIFRNKQPVSSRLITPYLGMAALLVESILISIVQRSVLVDYLFQTNRKIWEDEQNAASIVGNITMIIVNTLNLTAILSYVIQVVRYELLKTLYNKISADELEGSKRYKFLKVLTSPAVFITIITSFAVTNICYWTLWVILVRVNAISPSAYTSIISITYTVLIFLFSVVISIVAIVDISMSCLKKKEGFTNLDATMGSTDLNTLKKKNRFYLLKGRSTDLFSYDSPLFFRTEMILYLVCFAFLIIQQALGLTANEHRFRGNTEYDIALQYDIARFIFEVLYQFTYVLVFGGFSLIILLKLHVQKKVHPEQLGLISEMKNFLGEKMGHQVFEKFCATEFSNENLYLNDYLATNDMFTSGKYMDGLNAFMKNVHELFISTNSIFEVNIPSGTKKKFMQLYKEVNSDSFELNNAGQFNLRKQISDCFNELKSQIELNLEDSFSRFVFSSIYEDFVKQKDMKENFAKQMTVDLGIDNL